MGHFNVASQTVQVIKIFIENSKWYLYSKQSVSGHICPIAFFAILIWQYYIWHIWEYYRVITKDLAFMGKLCLILERVFWKGRYGNKDCNLRPSNNVIRNLLKRPHRQHRKVDNLLPDAATVN